MLVGAQHYPGSMRQSSCNMARLQPLHMWGIDVAVSVCTVVLAYRSTYCAKALITVTAVIAVCAFLPLLIVQLQSGKRD